MSRSIVFLIKAILVSYLIISSHCWDKQTPSNADGSGDLIFLDRHSAYCGDGEAMRGFQIVRPTGKTIAIAYNCDKTESITSNGSYTDFTSWTASADDIFSENHGTHKLKNIPIKCKNDYGLQGFKLESQCGKAICDVRFKFTCVPLKPFACVNAETNWVNAGEGQSYTLDKLWIDLPNYSVLTGFQLQYKFDDNWFSRDTRYFKYTYSYCNLRNVEAEKENYKKDKNKPPRKLEELKFLDDLDIHFVSTSSIETQ